MKIWCLLVDNAIEACQQYEKEDKTIHVTVALPFFQLFSCCIIFLTSLLEYPSLSSWVRMAVSLRP